MYEGSEEEFQRGLIDDPENGFYKMTKEDLILLIDALDAHRGTFTRHRRKTSPPSGYQIKCLAILEHIDALRERFMKGLKHAQNQEEKAQNG